jgi:hypothetical protein
MKPACEIETMQPSFATEPERLRLAIWGLRITQVFYLLLLLCTPLPYFLPEVEERLWVLLWTVCCMGGISIACVVGIEVVIRGLKQYKYWGWIAGLCVAGLYIPSLFLPFGIMILVGLLDSQTQAAFQRNK